MPRTFISPVFMRVLLFRPLRHRGETWIHGKRDLSPSVLDFGPVRFKIARHFGFCYGVENAVEIAYRALEENS